MVGERKEGRVLLVGLSGGIGSGKSTVARRFAEHGAVIIDSDVLAREVVAPGTEGLAEIVSHFGGDVLDDHGALDRALLARRAFADDDARAALNAIVHPRVAARTAELTAAAPQDAIVVHDIPLLVEAGYAANYHLVVIVDAPAEERVRRLVARGMQESDARARIRSQASDRQRRQAADVWLDNGASVADLTARVDGLWNDRLVEFEANLRARRWTPRGAPRIVDYNPDWPRQARLLMARVEKAAGPLLRRIDHIGSTSVPGLAAKDVLDLQLTVATGADMDALAEPLANAGFPGGDYQDAPKPIAADPAQWVKRVHASADPGRPANLHIRVAGNANWRYGLLFPAWLRADEQAREEYGALKRELAAQHAADADADRYASAKDPWIDRNLPAAERWAASTGWTP
jgi:dephospho-CoA kinase